jgi:L-seryl-tRNA(Ser) seleniumtransferase
LYISFKINKRRSEDLLLLFITPSNKKNITMKRRDLIKYLSVAPVAGAAIGASVPLDSLAAPAAAAAKRDVIKELGLRTFINAAGTYTTMTASLMHQEVVDTIESASKHFVMITEVQDKVGEKIAAMCHAESAMVTAGCWSALVLGTAGVLTRMDRKKVSLLPDV